MERQFVIPPGREPLVLSMLGNDANHWPDGCESTDLAIPRVQIVGRFRCPNLPSELKVTLVHPDHGAFGFDRTLQFAVRFEPNDTFPSPLRSAILARIRLVEMGWTWADVSSAPVVPPIAVPIRPPIVVVLLAVVLLAAGLYFVLERRRPSRRTEVDPVGFSPVVSISWGVWVVELVAFTVIVWLAEVWFVAAPRLNLDTAKDLLIAHDCMQHSAECQQGATTSFGGFVQGTVWIWFLATAKQLGLGIVGIYRLALGSPAIAGALGYSIVRTRRGRLLAIVAGVGTAVAGLWAAEYPSLWGPTITPACCVVGLIGLLRAVGTGSLPHAAWALVCVAVAGNAYISCWFALVPTFLAVAATVRQPIASVPFLAALTVSVGLLISHEATAILLNAVSTHLASAIGIGLLPLAGLSLRRVVARWTCRAREMATLAALIGIQGAACLIVALRWRHQIDPRYTLPAAIALPIGMALTVNSFRLRVRSELRWRSLLAVFGAVIAVVSTVEVDHGLDRRHAYNLADAEYVARRLHSEGWTFREMYRHLQTSWGASVIGAMGALTPDLSPDPGPDRRTQDLLLIKLPASEVPSVLPPAWQRWGLPDRSAMLLARELGQYVVRRQLRMCIAPPSASMAQAICTDTTLDPPVAGVWVMVPSWSVQVRAYPIMDAVALTYQRAYKLGAKSYRVQYTFPLELPANASSHTVRVAGDPCPRAPWRFVRTEGVVSRADLPAAELTLTPGTEPMRGSVTIERTMPAGNAGCWYEWPIVFEFDTTTEGDFVRRLAMDST